jgi:uncharacterized membrane protein
VNAKSLLIGGLLPTLLLGLGTVLMKLSMREGSSVPNYLVQVGGTVLCVGLVSTLVGGGWVSSPRAQMFAVLMGLAWASAIGSMAYAISTLGVPVSIIAPLTNSNALVALAISALVFRELATLDGPRLLVGALLIVVGAGVVATAKN